MSKRTDCLPFALNLGPDQDRPTTEELKDKRDRLCITVEHYLPSFVHAIGDVKKGVAEAIILHQDAFAGNLDYDEYALLGMAIKYAGLYDVPIQFIGLHRYTIDKE